MSQIKINYEDFLDLVDTNYRAFVEDLHSYMLENGCKATFEEKKTGLLGSYKYTKTKRAVINLLLKKHGLLVRIYGEYIGGYPDFLNTLPREMVDSIEKAGVCKRLVSNGCSPKCTGYDFTIEDKHFQKCRYNCFEFLVTEESQSYIKSFIENEIRERQL
ncbi:MAG: hypothetical protein FWC76_02880 [Defluviitaleaceae bacterium]|nr:hypothetical protein [Defluviitaleaceae bacterium]